MNQPLVPCRACGQSISVNASACPQCGQPMAGAVSPARKIVAACAAILVGLWSVCLVFGISIPRLFAGTPKAAVECRAAGSVLAAGMSCTMEHRGGSGHLDLCWSTNLTCSNGATGHAKACGGVEPESKAMTLVPFASFGGTLDRCDQVASMTVTDLTIK